MKHAKAEDMLASPAAGADQPAFDLSPLLGTWINTNPASGGITRVVLARQDDRLVIRAFEAGGPVPRDWGEVEAEGIYAAGITSRQAAAFCATYRLDGTETRLLANMSLGLLIIASVNTFTEGHKRARRFSREFFRRQADGEAEPARPELSNGAPPASDASHGPEDRAAHEPLSGTWVNTNSASRGLSKVILAVRGGQLLVRVFGVCDPALCDWGEVSALLFTKSICFPEAMAFTASYDLGFMEAELLAHVKLGVLVIAKFDRFKDGSGRSNAFSREFFYRADA